MKTHAVKEPITDNTLCVEVEPQPPEWIIKWDYLAGMKVGLIPPIAIGDTVYRKVPWIDMTLYYASEYPMPPTNVQPAETMPIEAADKTFKVVGIEVEWRNSIENYQTIAAEKVNLAKEGFPPIDALIIKAPETIEVKKKWFWSYKLEEMKG